MIGTIKAIYNILTTDTTLVNMLAKNAPWNDADGTSANINSIIPGDVVERSLNTPFLVILEGSEVSQGREFKSESFYIRCYNDRSKAYFEINEILERVRILLDKSRFEIEDRSHVETIWEITINGLVDETLQRKFKESRYRSQVL